MKILLVEDDINIATIAQLALQTVGQHEVKIAHDGHAALDILNNEKFDLVILDEMMPRMSGVQVCEHLAKNIQMTTPLLMMSANTQRAQNLPSNVIGFIAKPFDPMTLSDVIKNQLEVKKAV